MNRNSPSKFNSMKNKTTISSKLFILSLLLLLSLQFASADSCGGVTTSVPSSSLGNINIAYFDYATDDQGFGWGASGILMNPDSGDFGSSDMTQIFLTASAPGYTYAAGGALRSGGISYSLDCDSMFRAGTYIYGNIYGGIYLDMDTSGYNSNGYHSPDGYAAAQIYRLYSYSDTRIRSMMNNAVNNYWYNMPTDLTQEPTGQSLHLYGGYGQTRTGTLSAYPGYGVYFLALTGGLYEHNSENWNTYNRLSVSITGSQDYVISTSLLKTNNEIRNAFISQNKVAMFDTQANMCDLVGQHISRMGVNGESGRIKCCGAPIGGSTSDLGAGRFNYQFECVNKGSDDYVWESVCSKTYSSLNSAQQAEYDAHCSPCSTSTTGKCSGNLYSTCQGTYSCSGLSESSCENSPVCTWTPAYTLYCPSGTYNKGSDPNEVNYANIESFTEPSPPPGCYYVSDGGTCSGSGSCSGISLNQCNDISGCNRRDSQGSYVSDSTTCATYTYDMTQCSIRSGCSWSCRAVAGEECSKNDDCQSGMQCDADFNGVKRCHVTDGSCVVDVSGSETASGGFQCALGNNGQRQYKQCLSSTAPYSADLCSSTSGFTCTGSPSSTCIGYGSCYGLTNSECNSRSGYGCSWNLATPGNCYYSGSDPDCETAMKPLESGYNPYGKAQESFGADNRITGFLPADGCPSCSGTTQSSCQSQTDCYWYPGYSAHCSGSVSCSNYNSGNCPTWSGCSVFSSCSGQTYGNCQNGCTRSCTVPQYGSAIDPNTNAAACTCLSASNSIASCYLDGDGDGIASSTTGSLCKGPSTSYNEKIGNYICNYNVGYFDCNDGDGSITRYEYYRDADADTYGNFSVISYGCSAPAGYVTNNLDCRDNNNGIRPGATDIACNYIDEDCDGLDNQLGGPTWYRDADADGYGTSATTTQACTQPGGYVSNAQDCNDGNSSITLGNVCYPDFDYDNYENVTPTLNSCGTANIVDGSGRNYKCDNGASLVDCNDNNAGVTRYTCYADFDNDTYANMSRSTTLCSAGVNQITVGPGGRNFICNYNGVADCNDGNGTIATDCICSTFVQYNTRKFPESPIFRVPATGTITSVCDANSQSTALVRFNTIVVNVDGSSSGAAISTPVVRSLNLPPCDDFASRTKYCNDYGYDFATPYTSVAGACGAWSGGAWIRTTGSRVANMGCGYSTQTYDKVVFTVNSGGSFVAQKLNCSGSRIGSGSFVQGQDGICIDDFVSTPICGFAGLLPVDPDCGTHINMSCGIVRKADGTTVNTCTVPSPKPHSACPNPTDCVTNIGGQLQCLPAGRILTTGSSDTFTQVINISCSASNTWCFKGYNYQAGRCEYVSTEDCYIATCPGLSTFAFLPDGTVYKDGTIYRIDNTGDTCKIYNVETGKWTTCPSEEKILEYKALVGDGLKTLLPNSNCRITQGTKIRGVCVATQTYPELKYSVRDVVVK
ncbi:MAG TPA: hypothetical protein VEC16_00220 [Alphaproteobacteria bacterium]|nr:hypothetical protein [Alphaproteobacteria bacterium]